MWFTRLFVLPCWCSPLMNGLARREVVKVVWGGFVPPTPEVGCDVVVEDITVFRTIGIVCGLQVGFHPIFLENGPWTGWCCCGCVLALPSSRSIEYISNYILLPHPAADMIESEWLGISYLMDVFHVVYNVICVSICVSLASLDGFASAINSYILVERWISEL